MTTPFSTQGSGSSSEGALFSQSEHVGGHNAAIGWNNSSALTPEESLNFDQLLAGHNNGANAVNSDLIASSDLDAGTGSTSQEVQSVTITAKYNGVVIFQQTTQLLDGKGTPTPYLGPALNLTNEGKFSRFPSAVRDAVLSQTGGEIPTNFEASNRLYDQGWAVSTTLPNGDVSNPFDMVILDIKASILPYLAEKLGLSVDVLNGKEAPPAWVSAIGDELLFGITLDELKELQSLNTSLSGSSTSIAKPEVLEARQEALATKIEEKFVAGLNDAIQRQRVQTVAAEVNDTSQDAISSGEVIGSPITTPPPSSILNTTVSISEQGYKPGALVLVTEAQAEAAKDLELDILNVSSTGNLVGTKTDPTSGETSLFTVDRYGVATLLANVPEAANTTNGIIADLDAANQIAESGAQSTANDLIIEQLIQEGILVGATKFNRQPGHPEQNQRILDDFADGKGLPEGTTIKELSLGVREGLVEMLMPILREDPLLARLDLSENVLKTLATRITLDTLEGASYVNLQSPSSLTERIRKKIKWPLEEITGEFVETQQFFRTADITRFFVGESFDETTHQSIQKIYSSIKNDNNLSTLNNREKYSLSVKILFGENNITAERWNPSSHRQISSEQSVVKKLKLIDVLLEDGVSTKLDNIEKVRNYILGLPGVDEAARSVIDPDDTSQYFSTNRSIAIGKKGTVGDLHRVIHSGTPNELQSKLTTDQIFKIEQDITDLKSIIELLPEFSNHTQKGLTIFATGIYFQYDSETGAEVRKLVTGHSFMSSVKDARPEGYKKTQEALDHYVSIPEIQAILHRGLEFFSVDTAEDINIVAAALAKDEIFGELTAGMRRRLAVAAVLDYDYATTAEWMRLPSPIFVRNGLNYVASNILGVSVAQLKAEVSSIAAEALANAGRNGNTQ